VSSVAIQNLLAVPVGGAYFADDQAAITAGAPRDGLTYTGRPLTPGFDAIRAPAGAVSVLLQLSDGYVAHGDCVSVQYSGVGGREPPLHPAALVDAFDSDVAPLLVGRQISGFRSSVAVIDELAVSVDGFSVAGSHGLSQAFLDAAAHAAGLTMAELVQAEWGLHGPLQRVLIYAQTGEDRRNNVDKMILWSATTASV
jgi:methylaspartate ammonia-lyase